MIIYQICDYNHFTEKGVSCLHERYEMKNQEYHAVETVPKSNRKLVKGGTISNPNT
jgi:hypothetical protein